MYLTTVICVEGSDVAMDQVDSMEGQLHGLPKASCDAHRTFGQMSHQASSDNFLVAPSLEVFGISPVLYAFMILVRQTWVLIPELRACGGGAKASREA